MMDSSARDSLFQKLEEATGLSIDVIPLRIEASSRRYYRLQFSSPEDVLTFFKKTNTVLQTVFHFPEKIKQNSSSILLCINYDENDFINSDFYRIGTYLHLQNFSVPDIYGCSNENHFFTGEFSGNFELYEYLKQDPESREVMLYRSLDMLLKLHGIEPPEAVRNRFFDREKFAFEKDFLMNAVKEIDKEFEIERFGKLNSEFSDIIEKIIESNDLVFTHRDFHTRNILLSSPDRQAELKLIDYQDARMGHRYYDLTSLLFDPYSNFDFDLVNKGFSYYSNKSSYEKNTDLFFTQALQRILKALGSICIL